MHIDYEGSILGGPIDKGFDSYFGVDVPNFPPYTWFQDDRLTDIPTVNKPAELYGNPGLAQPGWKLENMIPEFTRRVVSFIESKESRDGKTLHEPFFLYFPLTSPHSPVVPNKSLGVNSVSCLLSYLREEREIDETNYHLRREEMKQLETNA